MILSDYLLSERNISWDYAKQVGVNHGVIRLPENDKFELTNEEHWKDVYNGFTSYGIKPVVIEPMPNSVHEHIKLGDAKRNESIEKVIKMLSIMDKLDIRIICFNFMAHIGWLRTTSTFKERGGALVTAFDINDFETKSDFTITKEQLWDNYTYFIKAIIPYAQKYNINLALHPDDPPIEQLGGVSRIMTSFDNINKAIKIANSPNIGVAMCQATYVAMGEDLERVIPAFANEGKIFFVHFRDIVGNKYKFHESFHDNGQTDMVKIMKLYKENGVNVPIRVDHVPTMAGENVNNPGYDAVGRLFAIGYLKGILDALNS